LLAYDSSPKADEALFVATYVAAKWGTDLTVVAVVEGERVSADTLTRAKDYLESHGVEATYVKESGPVPEAILKTAEDQERNMIIMGGYGHNPVLEVVIGSVVDQVLSESQIPTLICR
jgi:nucleotide-binding universal stress UspA family protein